MIRGGTREREVAEANTMIDRLQLCGHGGRATLHDVCRMFAVALPVLFTPALHRKCTTVEQHSEAAPACARTAALSIISGPIDAVLAASFFFFSRTVLDRKKVRCVREHTVFDQECDRSPTAILAAG